MNIEQAQAMVRSGIIRDGWEQWIENHMTDDEDKCDAVAEVELAIAFIATFLVGK